MTRTATSTSTRTGTSETRRSVGLRRLVAVGALGLLALGGAACSSSGSSGSDGSKVFPASADHDTGAETGTDRSDDGTVEERPDETCGQGLRAAPAAATSSCGDDPGPAGDPVDADEVDIDADADPGADEDECPQGLVGGSAVVDNDGCAATTGPDLAVGPRHAR